MASHLFCSFALFCSFERVRCLICSIKLMSSIMQSFISICARFGREKKTCWFAYSHLELYSWILGKRFFKIHFRRKWLTQKSDKPRKLKYRIQNKFKHAWQHIWDVNVAKFISGHPEFFKRCTCMKKITNNYRNHQRSFNVLCALHIKRSLVSDVYCVASFFVAPQRLWARLSNHLMENFNWTSKDGYIRNNNKIQMMSIIFNWRWQRVAA